MRLKTSLFCMKYSVLSKNLKGFRAALFVLSLLWWMPNVLADLSVTGMKINKPSGTGVEWSSRVSRPTVEITLKSDDSKVGLDWISATFRGPGDQSLSFYGDPADLLPASDTAVVSRNYASAKYLLKPSWIEGDDSFASMTGDWTLEQVEFGWGEWDSAESPYQDKSMDMGTLVANGVPAASLSFRMNNWISEQPRHVAVQATKGFSLAVATSSFVPAGASIKWYKNGVVIAGETQRTYTKAAATEAADAGVYYATITKGNSVVRSDSAVVSVRSVNDSAARAALNQQSWAAAKTAIAKDASAKSAESSFIAAMAEICDALGGSATQAAMKTAGLTGGLKFPNIIPTLPTAIPAGTSTALLNDLLSKTVVPGLLKAETALASITAESFVTTIGFGDINLWMQDPLAEAMVFDYGDVQAVRVMVNGLIFLLKTWETLDTNLRADVVETMYRGGKLSVQSILDLSKTLLQNSATAATAKPAAFSALSTAAAQYQAFSAFAFGGKRIADDGSHFVEAAVRFDGLSRQDNVFYVEWARLIKESLASGVRAFPLEIAEDGSVVRKDINFKALQTRGVALRPLIPSFVKNKVTGKSISDVTLGGTLPWVTKADGNTIIAGIAEKEDQLTSLLGTRDDQSAPLLIFTDVPVNGKEVLLNPEDQFLRLSGTVSDESEVSRVVMERTFGGVTETLEATLEELPSVYDPLTGKQTRTWRWTFDLDFAGSGDCSLNLYGFDRYKQKSVPKSLQFTVSRSVNVWVDVPLVGGKVGGTLVISPTIPADGRVKSGTKLKITATANPGYLFRLLEVVVDGSPESDISKASVDLVVSAETYISAQFIKDPFPALEGNWSGLLRDYSEEGYDNYGVSARGRITLTLQKTGAFSLKLVSGRNAFSASGKIDASGLVRIPVPESMVPYDGSLDDARPQERRYLNVFVDSRGTLSWSWDSQASLVGQSEPDFNVAYSLQKQQALSSFPGLASRYSAVTSSGGEEAYGYMMLSIGKAGTVLLTGRQVIGEVQNVIGAQAFTYSFSGVLTRSLAETSEPGPEIAVFAIGAPTSYALRGTMRFMNDGDSESPSYNSLESMEGLRISQITTGPLDPKALRRSEEGGYGELESYELNVSQCHSFAGISSSLLAPFSEDGQALQVIAKYWNEGNQNWEERELGALSFSGGRIVFAKTVSSAQMSVTSSTGAFSGSVSLNLTGVNKVYRFTGALVQSLDSGLGGVGVCADGTQIIVRRQ